MSPQSEPHLIGQDTSVPLFSGQLVFGAILMGTIWALVLRIFFHLTRVEPDIYLWAILTLSVGFFIHIAWNSMKKRRFRNPVVNREMLNLIAEVKRELGKGHDIELWYRNTDRQVFVSASNLFFKAILLSESAIADIIKKREKGKVLVAKTVLQLDSENCILNFMFGVLAFTSYSFISSLEFLALLDIIPLSFGLALMAIAMITIVIGGFAVLRLKSRRNRIIDETIERLYGISPDAALAEVLFGLPISEEMVEDARQKEKEGPSRQWIALRNGIITAVLAAPVSFGLVMFFMPNAQSSVAIFIRGLMVLLIPAGVFVIVCVTSFMWPLFTTMQGERNTDWDIDLPVAEEVQDILNCEEGVESLKVKGVKPPFDEVAGLVILRLKADDTEEVVHSVMPTVVQDLADSELIGPLALAELKMDEIERREKKLSFRVIGLATSFLAFGLLWLILGSLFLYYSLWVIFIYILIGVIPLGFISYWKRKAVVAADVEIATRYPRYRETLNILIESHHTLPYGKTSYKTRLERIEKRLEKETRVDFG